MEKLTQERLKELLDYDPATGVFVWRVNKGNVQKGDVAGNKDNGYVRIKIDGKQYLAHRLAFLYVYGYFPEHGVDHRDRIKHHNWITNLREASQSCNMKNCGNRKNNVSGVKGVYWNKQNKKWHTQIVINQKRKYLGLYVSFDNAVCARLAAEQACNWSGCDDSSPASQFVKEFVQCN